MAKSAHRKTKGKTAPPSTRSVLMQTSLTRALELSKAGRMLDAIDEFDRAIDEFGPCIELLYNRGVTYQKLGQHQEAIQTFVQVTENTPRSAVVHFATGVSHEALGDERKALRSYDQAIARLPQYPEALNSRGILLQNQSRIDEAIDAHRAAVDAEPTYADGYNSLGAALHSSGRNPEAVEMLTRALDLKPDNIEALINRGIAYQDLGRHDEARADLDRAVALSSPLVYKPADLIEHPAYVKARYNRSLLDLLQGDYENGWRDYEFRSLAGNGKTAPLCAFPGWDGTPIPNGTIYVRTEQGAGDTIQFLRYLPLVKERCAKLLLECPMNLAYLAAAIPGVDAVHVKQDPAKMMPAPPGSVEVYLLSLPGIFDTRLNTIPNASPYLNEVFDFRRIWRPRIEETPQLRPGMRVGIVWAGSGSHKKDTSRSCRFADFEPLLDIPGVNFYSLQKGPAASQLFQSDHGHKVIDLQYGLLDYGDTASAIKLMDLIISVDTSVAHLAGALGVATWTLLPSNPDWRWMLDREDSPWYPTMRLFRQQTAGDWSTVFERLQTSLMDMATARMCNSTAMAKPAEPAMAA